MPGARCARLTASNGETTARLTQRNCANLVTTLCSGCPYYRSFHNQVATPTGLPSRQCQTHQATLSERSFLGSESLHAKSLRQRVTIIAAAFPFHSASSGLTFFLRMELSSPPVASTLLAVQRTIVQTTEHLLHNRSSFPI